MLLPLSDVPRWYAERKPQGTIAVRHGQDTLTWDELERGANRRARAFAAKGVKPGDFVAIGLPNGNAVFETYFLNNDGQDATYHYLGAEPKRRANGWESLGDIGRLDAEGYLYVGDRLADMVLRGGANIYPAEVEAAVSECPGVRSCVVVGLPDPELGQRVHAIIEPEPGADGQAIADGMADFLKDRLSRYKHPESFEIVSGPPRDDSGKVRRTLLRDERAAWMKEGRAFRIMPAKARAHAE
ncbi:AMP-binding protein [Bradyrhizobium sp. Bra64]|uniref:AMP-binding enzyme n=1 Tax=Bradyrhizobium sp. Bra64 TaxID=2926009 RepID=UPI002119AC15|nr:AMP-binding protein [Bradyrhizobium sp. Bra64]